MTWHGALGEPFVWWIIVLLAIFMASYVTMKSYKASGLIVAFFILVGAIYNYIDSYYAIVVMALISLLIAFLVVKHLLRGA